GMCYALRERKPFCVDDAQSHQPAAITFSRPTSSACVVAAPALIYLLRWRGLHALRRIVAFSMLLVVTLAVATSAVFLLVSPSVADLSALEQRSDDKTNQWLGAGAGWESALIRLRLLAHPAGGAMFSSGRVPGP